VTTQQSKAVYGDKWNWVVRKLNGRKEGRKEGRKKVSKGRKVGSQGQIISKDTSLQVFFYMFQELH
jgi:hypothetical protein